MFCCKVVKNVLDNVKVSVSEIFINFSIKRGVNKMPQSFFLVEISPPNNLCAAFVCRLKTVSALLRLFSAAHYSWEMLESLVLWLCWSLFKPRRQLLMKNSKEENWFCGVVRFDFRIWSVSKVSLFEVLESSSLSRGCLKLCNTFAGWIKLGKIKKKYDLKRLGIYFHLYPDYKCCHSF